MTDTQLNGRSWSRVVGIGVAVGVLTALVMVILSKTVNRHVHLTRFRRRLVM